MSTSTKSRPEIFGTLLGIAPGDVPVYSSDYETVDPEKLPTRQDYRHYENGIYTGYKWQCVEFARRWLLTNRGYVFDDIAMAYDIFKLRSVKRIADQARLPIYSFENGSQRRPEPGCMLIWDEGGEFDVTGHVAIVTEVFDDCVRIAEQNLHHEKWLDGCDYSRELPVSVDGDGSYWISCSFDDASILGWVIQTGDAQYAVTWQEPESHLFALRLDTADFSPSKKSWLNIANADEAAYVAHNGHALCSIAGREHQFISISDTAAQELKRATNELHALFMHATDYVMSRDELQPMFNIPAAIWPRIKQSWSNRRNQIITGRFDFCMTENGLKVYEYNCDSASCHMEAGKIQGIWGELHRCDDSDDAGEDIFEKMVDAWRSANVNGVVHLLLDDNAEENYHTLFMQQAMQRAGLSTRIVNNFDHTQWAPDGAVLDERGDEIRWVWKTWAWETALDELREAIADGSIEPLSTGRPAPGNVAMPRLMDILLQPQTIVFEPLWTLVPSNKAILPILWDMFPEYPYLLETEFELNASLLSKGYVAKPIAGRCGHNISVVDSRARTLVATEGGFDSQNTIYQELSALPELDGLRVQLCTFTAGGSYAGACARVDPSLIITTDSDLMPLRIVSDKYFLD